MDMNILFANPQFLFGLFAIAIPIIIHLFNFRRYKVMYFSNTRMLQNINQQTKSKTKLKHILVLVSRILAVTCLVFAFSQPYIPVSKKQTSPRKGSVVSIYIDNSFSMSSEGENGQLLEEAKKRAEKIILNYPPGTNFVLLSNEPNPESHFFLSKEIALETIKSVSLSPSPVKLSGIVELSKSVIQNNAPGNKMSMYAISDFQKNGSDIMNLASDSINQYYFITVSPRVPANIFIDSCWFEKPLHSLFQPEKLFVSIRNNSDESFNNVSVRCLLNDTVKAFSSVSLTPNEHKTIALDYNNSAGKYKGVKVEITDYPVVYDNTYFLAYEITTSYNALQICQNTPNKYIQTILSQENNIKLTQTNVASLNYAMLKTCDIVILDGLEELSSGLEHELQSFIREGGTMILTFSKKTKINTFATIFDPVGMKIGSFDANTTRSGSLAFKHFLFQNVFKKEVSNADLPVIEGHFPVEVSQHSQSMTILWSESKDPLIASAPLGSGQILVFFPTFDHENESLLKHPIFLPLILNSVLLSKQSFAIDCKAGVDNLVKIKQSTSNEKVLHLSNQAKTYDEIPRQTALPSESATRLFIGQNTKEAGIFYITDGNINVKNLSFNFGRQESNLEFYTAEEITELAKKAKLNAYVIDKPVDFSAQTLKRLDRGIQLWKIFVTLALAFLLSEILLIRLWRNKVK